MEVAGTPPPHPVVGRSPGGSGRDSPFATYRLHPAKQGAWRSSPPKCFLFSKLGRGREGSWNEVGVLLRI